MGLHRYAIALLAIAPFVLPASASAQTDDLRVRYYMDPGYAGEGMPYRDCSLNAEMLEEEPQDELSDAPARMEDVTLDSGLTPEEAEALRREMHTELESMVRQLDELLDNMPPDYARRPEILFRKAEALKELSDADNLVARARFSECIDNWYACVSDAECYEPMPDYVEAIEEYRSIARNHPSYERLDEVVFRLGETLMENDNASEGIQFLTRLVNTYPDSEYIADARLLMGEHYFDNDLLIAARQNYEEVLNFPQASIYNYAIYKIAWIDINEYDFETALARFQEVVRNLDMLADPELDFRTQSLNDMLKCYVELPDGWLRAREYYESYEGEDLMRRQLARLANLYDDQGKDEDRIAVLDYFIQRFPTDEQLPQWSADVLASLTNIGNWDRYEENARDFIDYMAPNGPWYLQNMGNDRTLANANGYTHDWMLGIINRNYTEGDRFSDPELSRPLYEECEADYQFFFERFPDSEETYDLRFFHAELLYYKLVHDDDDSYPGCSDAHYSGQTQCDDWLRASGEAYRTVVEMNPDPAAEHAHPSAVGALQVFDDFMKRRVPDIDDPLPPPGEMVTWSCEQAALYGGECDQTTGEIIVQPTMPPEARDYVDIVEWFAMLYPEDELIPAASWRAAGLYLRTFEIAEAAHRFETIIEHHPRHRFAQQAALGAFVCYNHVEDWIKIERVARMLLDVCDEVEDDEICSPERLAQAIAYAMNNQAEDLMDAGDGLRESGDLRGARGQYVLAAERRVALYREFPDSEWSPLALYNAAATYETARDIDESVSLYNEFITRYDEHEFIPDAKFTLGLIHDSQANFLLAVDWFEQVMEYDDFVDRSAAVLNAARLREALSQFDDAIEHYEEYMSLEPTAPIINDLYFVLADIEHDDLNDLDAAYSRYSSFLDDVSDDHVRRLIAVHRQAKIREEQDRDRDALSLHEQVYNLYGPGEMGFGEDDLPTDWITAPGANFADEAERIAVLPYAAEARFNLAEASYEAARAADLTYREGEWEELTEKLSARGEAIVAAQHEMWTVYRMGDAAWAVAATARIGQTYYDFYRDIFALEAPDYDRCLDLTNWDYDACDEFMEMYDETLFNIGEPLRAKAEGAWGQGRDAAIQNNIFNEWTTQITALLNDLDRTYALGMTEGFDADHTSDAYLSTNYTLDLAEKLDAFADFVEPMLLDGPGLQLDGGEGVAPEPEMPEHSAPVDEPGQEPEAAPVDDAATEGGEG